MKRFFKTILPAAVIAVFMLSACGNEHGTDNTGTKDTAATPLAGPRIRAMKDCGTGTCPVTGSPSEADYGPCDDTASWTACLARHEICKECYEEKTKGKTPLSLTANELQTMAGQGCPGYFEPNAECKALNYQPDYAYPKTNTYSVLFFKGLTTFDGLQSGDFVCFEEAGQLYIACKIAYGNLRNPSFYYADVTELSPVRTSASGDKAKAQTNTGASH